MTTTPTQPEITAIGSASWDHFMVIDRYPIAGDYCIISEEASMPGGTTSNSAVALARLEAGVALVAVVGGDVEGIRLRAGITAAGVDDRWLQVRAATTTDRAAIVVSDAPPSRTIFWRVGVRLGPMDNLDLDGMFGSKVILLDVDDAQLRDSIGKSEARMTSQAVVLGTSTYLVGGGKIPGEGLSLALQDDFIVGNEEQIMELTNANSLGRAAVILRESMGTSRLSACVITRGASGCTVLTADNSQDFPAWSVDAIDTTGAGDAFAGALALGLSRGWEWSRIAPFANAVGALTTRSLGAQTSLPTIGEVAQLMRLNPEELLRST